MHIALSIIGIFMCMYTLISEDPSGYWFGEVDWFGRNYVCLYVI